MTYIIAYVKTQKIRWHGFILIPAWISYHMPIKLCDELLIYSQTFMAAPLKFGNGLRILSYTLYWM